MEIVLTTNEKRLIFAIHGTGGGALTEVYVEDRKDTGKLQPLGKVEFVDVMRMAKALAGLWSL